jgi:hypothetical protein
MKVKVFSWGVSNDVSEEELEKQMNEWLGANSENTIVEISVATTAGVNHAGVNYVNITVIVWYLQPST